MVISLPADGVTRIAHAGGLAHDPSALLPALARLGIAGPRTGPGVHGQRVIDHPDESSVDDQGQDETANCICARSDDNFLSDHDYPFFRLLMMVCPQCGQSFLLTALAMLDSWHPAIAAARFQVSPLRTRDSACCTLGEIMV
jgi:hypothetical protein